MAMLQAVLLADENIKLRATNAKQKAKKKGRSKQIAKGGALSIIQGRDRIRAPVVPVEVQNPQEPEPQVETDRRGLPSCWKCYAYDQLTRPND